jgi:predicted DNA-binding transcriptional regulator
LGRPRIVRSGVRKLGRSELDDKSIASKLKGNTLRVYWNLLRSSSGVVRVRETQRSLGFSSPALAVYHLEKLVELGLVRKVRGEYCLVRVVNIGVLKQFMRIRTFLLPRCTFYATMFTTLLIFYVSQIRIINFYSVFALIFGILATGILWFETVRTWRQRP